MLYPKLVLIFSTGLILTGCSGTATPTQITNTAPTVSTSAVPTTQQIEYRELSFIDLTYLRQERHYLYIGSDQPSAGKVTGIFRELKKNCPSDKICDYMLWDSEAAFQARNNTSNLSNEYSLNNKIHLIGYLNTGGLFYHYGGNETYLSD